MAQFPLDAPVAVRPFAARREGPSVTIGDVSRQVFLTVPAEALDIMDALAAGKTVGETVALYEQTHGETPDIQDFLAALADEGFVAPWGDEPIDTEGERGAEPSFAGISASVAQRLFDAPVLAVCALLVAGAMILVATDPSLVPGPTVLVFHHDLAVQTGALFVVIVIGVMTHELGHLLAARASGVLARIGLSHRLWIVVAETDMTGIWMVPKRRRYLAFLAGPIIDAAGAAVLIGVLWMHRRGWIGLSSGLEQFTGAVLLSYLLRLLWQCFVFVRTDFYYVIATALDCKSLLSDTENLLRNRLARLRRRRNVVDQSAIPPREMRAVRAYCIVWLVGRTLAFASLVFITLPVIAGYATELVRAASGDHSRYATVDLLTLAIVGLGLPLAGILVWVRSLLRGQTQRRTHAVARP